MPFAKPPATVTLTNANVSYLVAPENPSRTTIAITNMHESAIVFLAFGHTAVLNAGFVVPPHGSYQMDALDNSPSQIQAISTTPNVMLAIQEMGT